MPTFPYFLQIIVFVGLFEIRTRMVIAREAEEFARNDEKLFLDSL
jgi:hypothetical protein